MIENPLSNKIDRLEQLLTEAWAADEKIAGAHHAALTRLRDIAFTGKTEVAEPPLEAAALQERVIEATGYSHFMTGFYGLRWTPETLRKLESPPWRISCDP